ncbi:MAG TPA: hypothetical protein VGS10_05450 [Terracidiphilus sp.]|nr:hypothetical protein [Terracidiphilus sp.]
MSKSRWSIVAGLCTVAVGTVAIAQASAQTEAVKAKAPMYSYVSSWQIPRAHWGEMKNETAAEKEIMDKAMADGTLLGWGYDQNLVHTANGWTHDDWFSSSSMGGLMTVLKQLYASGTSTSPVLESATNHYDLVFVSRFYGWHSGSYQDGIVSVSTYKLKEHAPDNALDAISGEVVAPLLDKLLADGTIVEYEIDTMAVHTAAPGSFWIVTVVNDPADLDKVDDAIRAAIKSHPGEGVEFEALTDSKAHRDEMGLGSGTFK